VFFEEVHKFISAAEARVSASKSVQVDGDLSAANASAASFMGQSTSPTVSLIPHWKALIRKCMAEIDVYIDHQPERHYRGV
jgi:hypothetical protein